MNNKNITGSFQAKVITILCAQCCLPEKVNHTKQELFLRLEDFRQDLLYGLNGVLRKSCGHIFTRSAHLDDYAQTTAEDYTFSELEAKGYQLDYRSYMIEEVLEAGIHVGRSIAKRKIGFMENKHTIGLGVFLDPIGEITICIIFR